MCAVGSSGSPHKIEFCKPYYAYVLNNPLSYSDPSGYRVEEGCGCSISQSEDEVRETVNNASSDRDSNTKNNNAALGVENQYYSPYGATSVVPNGYTYIRAQEELAEQRTVVVVVDNAQKEQQTAGPGKWVTTDVNKRGIRNFFQILVKRTETIGDKGRLWGSDGKDFEGTVQDVTQTWTALSTSETQALTEQGLVSVTRTYGDTRVITQTYLEGPDAWNPSGKSWYWQPTVRREEFEFVDTQKS